MKIDNFSLEQFVCPAMYDLRINKHIVPLKAKPSLSFGSVLHYGLAEWYRTGSEAKALMAIGNHWPDVMPSDDFRTKAYALLVMHSYVETYPEEPWKIIQTPSGGLIEQPFTLDTGLFLECQDCGFYSNDDDFQTGVCGNCSEPLEPLQYGGILDVGADFNGSLYVVDHKTTTKLGKENSDYYFHQFNPDNQMTGYIWALNKLTNQKVGGAIINAMGLYKSGEIRFKRHITNRNQFQIDEWLRSVLYRCNEIKRSERTGVWRMETTQCMNYGECSYRSIHILSDPVSRQKLIEQDYVKSEWDYEQRDD